MILTGPSSVTIVPPLTSVAIGAVHFDLVAHVFVFTYGTGQPGQDKRVAAAIPTALQTALENFVQGAIEQAESWTAGSSTITTP
jgi:hypothetical protein